MNKKFYITTAIAYPNGKPHMWHALEIIIADVLARSYRMMWMNVEFQTWTDEHWIKNRRTAQKENKDIYDFLDENVSYFKNMYSKLDITYNTFLRTSDKENHYIWAQELRNKLVEAGDLEKREYEGLYCEWCESYKTEKELENGKCPDHQTKEIEKIKEENYFFKLSKYKELVSQFIEDWKYKILPESRKNEILSFLKEAKDVSFSRQKAALPWGIPVPNDEEHVMYVWCDALSNYLTGQWYWRNDNREESRPADIHIIWKDILRFHAAFWPAMLFSADLKTPRNLLAHWFLTLNGKKMSTSTWNVVDPMKVIEKYWSDVLKFNLLYDIWLTDDGDFSIERLDGVYNSMLIWAWWNLINRVTKLSKKYWITNWELWDHEDWFVDFSLEHFSWNIKRFNTKKILEDRYKLVQKANEFITIQEPRVKYKDEKTQLEAISDLKFLLYVLKNLAIISAPVLTTGFDKIKTILWNTDLSKIDTSNNIDSKSLQNIFLSKTFPVDLNPEIIYPRIED